MGAARLLAKGWVAFCLFAGAHAFARALAGHMPPEQAISVVGICVALFGAMGLLFVGGYGVAAGGGGFSRLNALFFLPGFNEIVFIAFAALVFTVQITPAPGGQGSVLTALAAAIRFAVPGQRALETQLAICAPDAGRAFASAVSWTLAFVFLGSALSRLRLAAGLMRLERKARGDAAGIVPVTFAIGLFAVIGIQFLFVGTIYAWLPCGALGGLPGAVLIGLAPLALAYVIIAALTNLLALNPEA